MPMKKLQLVSVVDKPRKRADI